MAADETTDVAGAMPANSTPRRAVTAFFDDRAAAQTAIDDIIAAGVARSRVTLVEGGAEPIAREAVASSETSLWQRVKALFMADEDRHAYGEGLRRGGFLVSVDTTPDDHDQVVDLLDRDGAVDIDARAEDWSLQGWDPVRAAADLGPSAAVGPAFGRSDPRSAGSTGVGTRADHVAAADVAPSVAVGPAFGQGDQRRPTGPTAIRDPGAISSRLRTYVEPRDPGAEDAPR